MEILLRLGMEFFITQSFAKNFGLYGERIGYVHVCCSDKDRAAAVLSQLKLVVPRAACLASLGAAPSRKRLQVGAWRGSTIVE